STLPVSEVLLSRLNTKEKKQNTGCIACLNIHAMGVTES
ncbi:hypothetical protein LEMLEM_LOCUS8990, partial [Lemmus lemmus]